MLGQAKRTGMDSFQRINRVDHIENGEFCRIAPQRIPPLGSPLGRQNARLGQPLEDFHKVAGGGLRPLGDLTDLPRLTRPLAKPDGRPQTVLAGIREKFHPFFL